MDNQTRFYKKSIKVITDAYTPEEVLKTSAKDMLEELDWYSLFQEEYTFEKWELFQEVFKQAHKDILNFIE